MIAMYCYSGFIVSRQRRCNDFVTRLTNRSLKEWTLGYVLLTEKYVIPLFYWKSWRIVVCCEAQLSNGCNGLLSAYKRDFAVLCLHFDFSTAWKTSCSNGILIFLKVKRMLEGKDYSNILYIFSISCSIYQQSYWMHRRRNDEENSSNHILTFLTIFLSSRTTIYSSVCCFSVRRSIGQPKRFSKELLRDTDEFSLFKIKFYMLDLNLIGVGRFGDTRSLSLSFFEHLIEPSRNIQNWQL